MLAVAPASLAFAEQGAGDPAPKSLDVDNTGGGTLEWTASADVPWLRVTPERGTGAASVTVTPTRPGLAGGTTRTSRSRARAGGSPR